MKRIDVNPVKKTEVDPAFCKKECCAGRTDVRCLVIGDCCKHPVPRRRMVKNEQTR